MLKYSYIQLITTRDSVKQTNPLTADVGELTEEINSFRFPPTMSVVSRLAGKGFKIIDMTVLKDSSSIGDSVYLLERDNEAYEKQKREEENAEKTFFQISEDPTV